jgi:hypothetical protein
MRIRRAIVIPAILTLGLTGSILAGAATHVAAVPASSAHVVAASPNVMLHE